MAKRARQILPKDERRRQLLEAAIRVFGNKGYHHSQISDIIKEAGVARGTFYLYFESKREIFDGVITTLFEMVRSQVKTLPRDAIADIPEQLRGNLERITNLLLGKPWLVKLLFNESVGLDAELDERLRSFYGQLLDLIRRALRQGQEMGFVREGNIHVLATTLLGSVKEVFYQHCLGTEQPAAGEIVEELFKTISQAVITGHS